MHGKYTPSKRGLPRVYSIKYAYEMLQYLKSYFFKAKRQVWAYNNHSIAKRIPAASVGAPMEDKMVTVRTMLALGMFGVAREDVKVRKLKAT